MYEWREEERTLQWRVGGEEGRSGTITGSRKQDGGWSLLLPLTLCLHPLLPQPQARTKHGTAAHFTPPTFDLLHKDGTIWARCLQIKCNISVILSALEGNKRIHFVKTFPDRVQCCPMQCSWVGVETASVYTHYLHIYTVSTLPVISAQLWSVCCSQQHHRSHSRPTAPTLGRCFLASPAPDGNCGT